MTVNNRNESAAAADREVATSTSRSEETIENNSREDQFGGSNNKNNNKTSREATASENGSESKAVISAAVEKMPTKEVVVSDRMARDGNYFLDVMNNERNRILGLADICDRYMDGLVSESAYGMDRVG